MRFRPVTLVLSAVFLLTSALSAGCVGDDNSLPLPPSDGGSDSGDAAKSEGGDAATSEGGDAATAPGEGGADAPPGDATAGE
jgi:hypothetical protein